VFLEFKRGGTSKWYAKTEDGEYAWSDVQGLYIWTHDEHGILVRVALTGGDRQCSKDGAMYQLGGASHPDPVDRGFHYALYSFNHYTN
jgi:hypothetical protein